MNPPPNAADNGSPVVLKSTLAPEFHRYFAKLPPDLQRRAREAFARFAADPWHPSLHFKLVNPARRRWAARISRSHRVLGDRDGDTIRWFWIGPHDEYERLI